jgi:prevent-host-death family protein
MSINPIQLDQDIQSLSEFRANAASFIDRIKTQRRPLILTQHGKSSAVLLDVEEYQNLINTVQILQEVTTAREQIKKGDGVDHDVLFTELRSKYSTL